MLRLPPLPPTLPQLTDEQIERADRKRPWPAGRTLAQWCPTCLGEKKFDFYVPQDLHRPHTERAVDTYECDCRAQFTLWRLFNYANLGDRYGKLNWDDVVGVEVPTFAFIQQYALAAERHLRQGTGLFLTGRNGNGKTLLASLVFRKFLALGHSGFFTTFNDLIQQETSGWRDQTERQWALATVQRSEVLVIDDLGKESTRFADSSMPILDRVFRDRVQDGYVTIITTNMDEPQYHERYSSSIVSLVTEACLEHEFRAEDWRPHSREIREYEASRNLRRPYTLGA